jgi:integrase
VAKVKAKGAPTFSQAAAEFLQREKSPDKYDATRQSYANSLKRVGRELGDIKVSDIDRHAIRDALATINQESALATTKLVHCTLGVMFRWLVDREVIAASPVQTFKALKLGAPGRETTRREALSAGQVTALLEASTGDSDLQLWVQVMVGSGMRPGEALALTWGSIGLAAIRVSRSVKEGGIRGQGVLGKTKTKGSERSVPLGPALAAALTSAYSAREALLSRLNIAIAPDDCVFPADVADARKVPRSMGSMSAKFNRARDVAGLPRVTPHWLRHTFATAAVSGTATSPGVSMVDAAALLGHASAAMVAKVYGHAVAGNLARGVALADNLIAPRPSPPDNVTPLRRAV